MRYPNELPEFTAYSYARPSREKWELHHLHLLIDRAKAGHLFLLLCPTYFYSARENRFVAKWMIMVTEKCIIH